MDTKATKLIKGWGLSKILIEANYQAMGINLLAEISELNVVGGEGKSNEQDNRIAYKYLCFDWYKNIVQYLLFLSFPSNLDREKYKALRMKTQKYVIINGQLY